MREGNRKASASFFTGWFITALEKGIIYMTKLELLIGVISSAEIKNNTSSYIINTNYY